MVHGSAGYIGSIAASASVEAWGNLSCYKEKQEQALLDGWSRRKKEMGKELHTFFF